MEGETKQPDGLTWLTPTPSPYFMTDIRHWRAQLIQLKVMQRRLITVNL